MVETIKKPWNSVLLPIVLVCVYFAISINQHPDGLDVVRQSAEEVFYASFGWLLDAKIWKDTCFIFFFAPLAVTALAIPVLIGISKWEEWKERRYPRLAPPRPP